jgi:hypothetical protein
MFVSGCLSEHFEDVVKNHSSNRSCHDCLREMQRVTGLAASTPSSHRVTLRVDRDDLTNELDSISAHAIDTAQEGER